MKRIVSIVSRKLALILAFLFVFVLSMVSANAQTDMTGVVDSVETIVAAATTVGIGVLLFVLGRKVLRKLI